MITKKVVNNRVELTASVPSSKGSPLTMSHVNGYNVKITNEQGESLSCSIKDFNELNFQLEQWAKFRYPNRSSLTDNEMNTLFATID